MRLKEIPWFALYYLQMPLLLFVDKIKGGSNIPKNEPVILAINHHSALDATLIYLAIYTLFGTKIRFLTHEHFYSNPFLKFYLNFYNCIVVEEKNRNKCLEAAIYTLMKGGCIGIFPEGKRTEGKIGAAKTGIVRLAIASKAPIVPIRITNTHNILPKGAIIPRLNRTNIIIGEPIRYNKVDALQCDYSTLKSLSEKVLDEIYKLR